MKQDRGVAKAVLAFVLAALIPLTMFGCKGNGDHPSGRHEHPSKSEHPSGEHPK